MKIAMDAIKAVISFLLLVNIRNNITVYNKKNFISTPPMKRIPDVV